jgi:hypothetical protein
MGTSHSYDIKPFDNGGFALYYSRGETKFNFLVEDDKEETYVLIDEYHPTSDAVIERIRQLDYMTTDELRAQKRLKTEEKGPLASPSNE